MDIAIEHCGDAAAALDICIDNNILLTQMPTASLQIGDVRNPKITQLFVSNNYSPATGIVFSPALGIEEFIVGVDAQILE